MTMVLKGTYLLFCWLDRPLARVRIGRLGQYDLAPGCYLYIGSAFGPGGLRARLAHHQRREKPRPHWHFDYLRPFLDIQEVWAISAGARHMEQEWCASLLATGLWSVPIPGFGASDSACPAHLLYRPGKPARPYVAMMDERMVRDKETATGAPKEKTPAAHHASIKTFVLSEGNTKASEEELMGQIPQEFLLIPAASMDEVVQIVVQTCVG